jgi:hypothetical protein
MHFIDDVDFVFVLGGKILDVLPQLPDFVDPPIRGPVNLQNVNRDPLADFFAKRAMIAGMGGRALLAIQGLGQDPGH